MINLLPYEDKKEVEREGLRRFLIVAIFSIAVLVFLGILLMSPVYLIILQEKIGAEKEEKLLNEGESPQQIKQVTSQIKELNSKLAVIDANSKNISIPETINKALNIMPGGIRVQDISFERSPALPNGKISLKGIADTRENLLAFLRALNESGAFSKVESPVSNILKKTDVDFLISLELK